MITINGYRMSDADLKRRQELLDSTGDVVRPSSAAQRLREQNIRGGFGSVQRRQQLLDEDRVKREQQTEAAKLRSTERQQLMQSVTGPAATEARRAAGLAEVARIEGRSAVEQKRIEGLTAIQQEQEKAKSAPKFQIAQPGSALVDPRTGEMGAQVPYKEPGVGPTEQYEGDIVEIKDDAGTLQGYKVWNASKSLYERRPLPARQAGGDPLGGGAAPAAQPSPTPTQQSNLPVMTPDEARRAPSGTRYKDINGNIRTKP